MQFLCEANTTGGPVAILQQRYLSLWDGNDDYFQAIKQQRDGCLQLMPAFKNNCTLCLFHQESDGNFHVFFDRENFLVLSEISADEGYEMNRNLPPIKQAIVGRLPVRLRSFGGRVLVFDATIPGAAIGLQQVGCEQVKFGTEAKSHRPDAVLIDVETGDWQALELFSADDHLAFNGVWFQHIP